MTFYIAPIVEGHTEADNGCIEKLLQRIWNGILLSPVQLQVLPPSRCNRDSIFHDDRRELTNKINEAYRKLSKHLVRDVSNSGMVLLILDAEKKAKRDPTALESSLFQAAKSVRSDIDISCVIANSMFECWIVAGSTTLAGVNDLPPTLPAIDASKVELLNGASWLDDQLRSVDRGRKYKKSIDAVEFVKSMDIRQARANSPSFDKLVRELEKRIPKPPESAPADGADSIS